MIHSFKKGCGDITVNDYAAQPGLHEIPDLAGGRALQLST